MKTKLTVIDPDGNARTRTTARTYTHVVFFKVNKKYSATQGEYYAKIASEATDPETKAWALRHVDYFKAEAEDTRYRVMCWCGRADLANKQIAAAQKNPSITDVIAVEIK